MPVPVLITDLDRVAASNYPQGSDTPSTLDDVQRAHASFIALLRDGGGSAFFVPSGTVLDYAGATPPTGFLLCDGSAVSRATYSALFAAISTTWGAGDGSTTFNVPDLRRRTTIGAGGVAVAGPANTLGAVGGEEAHALTAAENGPHTHAAGAITITDNGHGHTANNPGISHQLLVSDGSGGLSSPSDPSAKGLATVAGTSSSYFNAPGGLPASPFVQATATGVTVNSATSGITASGAATASSGSGTAHNNMQPSAVVNKIIKT